MELKQPNIKSPGIPINSAVTNQQRLDNRQVKVIQVDILQSKNYVSGTAGWRLSPTGVELNVGVIISGYIEDGGAAADVNANATTINGGKITADTITANQIAANAITTSELNAASVTASKISVSTLSAISADLGTITAGTITGATIRTAASGARVQLSGTSLSIFDSGDVEIGTISSQTLGGIAVAADLFAMNCSWFSITEDSVGNAFLITQDAVITVDVGDLVLSTRKNGGGGGNVAIVPETGESILLYGPITVNSNKAYDIAEAATAIDDVYADDFQNVADFLFLDDRDDLAELDKIKGSGIYDERTGLEMIDDNTVPEWMLTKHKETGQVVYTEDGKPYIALKTVISLLMGAVRQLDKRTS